MSLWLQQVTGRKPCTSRGTVGLQSRGKGQVAAYPGKRWSQGPTLRPPGLEDGCARLPSALVLSTWHWADPGGLHNQHGQSSCLQWFLFLRKPSYESAGAFTDQSKACLPARFGAEFAVQVKKHR